MLVVSHNLNIALCPKINAAICKQNLAELRRKPAKREGKFSRQRKASAFPTISKSAGLCKSSRAASSSRVKIIACHIRQPVTVSTRHLSVAVLTEQTLHP